MAIQLSMVGEINSQYYVHFTVYEDTDGDGNADNVQTVKANRVDGGTSWVLDKLSGSGAQYWIQTNAYEDGDYVDAGSPVQIEALNISDVIGPRAYVSASISDTSSIDLTVYEDTTGDGNADNTEKIDAQNGAKLFTLDNLVGGGGNDYWFDAQLFRGDGSEDTPVLDELGVITLSEDDVKLPSNGEYCFMGSVAETGNTDFRVAGVGNEEYPVHETSFEETRTSTWNAGSGAFIDGKTYFPIEIENDDGSITNALAVTDKDGYRYNVTTDLTDTIGASAPIPGTETFLFITDAGDAYIVDTDGNVTAQNQGFAAESAPSIVETISEKSNTAAVYRDTEDSNTLGSYYELDTETLDVTYSGYDTIDADPFHVVFDSDGTMYSVRGTVKKIDPVNGTIEETYSISNAAGDSMHIGPTNIYVYVDDDSTVRVLDRDLNEKRVLDMANIQSNLSNPVTVVKSPTGRLVVIGYHSDTGSALGVSVYDEGTEEIVATGKSDLNFDFTGYALSLHGGSYAASPQLWDNRELYCVEIDGRYIPVGGGYNLSESVSWPGAPPTDAIHPRSNGGGLNL